MTYTIEKQLGFKTISPPFKYLINLAIPFLIKKSQDVESESERVWYTVKIDEKGLSICHASLIDISKISCRYFAEWMDGWMDEWMSE